MILINPDQYFVIITDSAAAIDYNYAYTFFDANNQGTKIETSQGLINSATSTELINSNTRIQKISTISIRNTDGALTNNVTIARKVGASTYAITANVQLLTGEFMEYDEGSGWKVYDANGIQKYVGSTGPAAPSGTISAGTTAMTLGQLEFINSNSITWGLSGNSLTASFGGGGGGGNMSWSAGTQSRTLGSVVFSNSNGVSFGLTGSTITASHNGLTTQSAQAFSAQGGSSTFQTLVFSNSNGVSFINSNGSLVASHNGLTTQTVQTQNMVSVNGSTGNISFANSNGVTFGANASTITASVSFNQSSLVYSNSNNVTFGIAGSTLTASASFSQSTQPGLTIEAGTESRSANSVVFSNSNGVSFGMNAGTITASYTQSVQPAIKTVSAGTAIVTNGELILSNSNGVSFGLSGNTITASVGAAGNPAISAGNGSFTFQTLSLADSNGISFSTGTQGVYATYTVPSTAGLISAVKLSAGTLSTNRTDVTFADSNNVSFGLNTNGVLTASASFAQSVQPVAISGSNGSFSYNTLTLGNLNGVSFYTSNGSMVASHNGLTSQTIQTQNMVSVLGSTGNISFANSNGITIGGNASTITLSHNGLTSQSAQALSGSNGSFTFQTASFGNLNGMSFYTSNGSVVGSYSVPSTAGLLSAINLSAGTTSNNLSAFTIANSNGLSFGLNGSVLTASHDGLTAQSVQTQNLVSVLGSTGNISFANGNGITFGGNASTITASHNGITSQTNQTLGLYAVSNTTQGTSMTADARTLSFHGAGVASVGMSNGSVMISVPAGGGGLTNINVSAGTTSNNLSALTFANSNNVSFGLNGSVVTASINAGAGGGIALANSQTTYTSGTANMVVAGGAMTIASTTGQSFNFSVPATSSLSATGQVSISVNGSTISIGVPNALSLSYFNPQDGYVQVVGQQGNGSMHFQPMQAPNVIFDRLVMPMVFSNATNSTGSATVSMSFGIYTNNASTLSLLSSVSYSAALTFSGTVNNSTFAGLRLHTIGFTNTLNESQYYVGIWSRSTSGGANVTLNQLLASQMNSVFSGMFGSAINASNQYTRGLGHYSTTFSTAMPSAVPFSDLRGTASIVLRQPIFYLVNGTV